MNQWEMGGRGGGGRREKTKKIFLPSPPLSPYITLAPTSRVAISTLPSLTNKNKPLFWEKRAQKPKLASMHFVRGCAHLMLGNQCLGISTKWCCVHVHVHVLEKVPSHAPRPFTAVKLPRVTAPNIFTQFGGSFV